MRKTRSSTFKPLIVVGLPAAAGLVIFQAGAGILAAFLSVSGLAVLLWYFTRKPRPDGELPCASVSCCHYLQDDEEEHKTMGS